jgi:hypothetical protein
MSVLLFLATVADPVDERAAQKNVPVSEGENRFRRIKPSAGQVKRC